MATRDTAFYRGEGGTIIEMDLPLPEVMAEKVTKGYLRRVNPDGTPYAEPTPAGEGGQGGSDLTKGIPARPAQSAPKAEWVGYAVRVHGLNPDDAEAMTKQDLVDKYGREG